MILLLGDIHGNFEIIKGYIEKYTITNATIIQIGDFGIGYDNKDISLSVLLSLNNFLKETNNKLFVVRGNHDDPDYFNGEHIYSNLELLPDYTTKIINDKKFLFIGGAISVDRTNSINYDHFNWLKGKTTKSYWFNECVVYNEEMIKNIKDVDVLITHTTPDFCFPANKNYPNFVLNYFKQDPKLKQDLEDERILMTKIFNELLLNNNITHHFYGHYHNSKSEKINNVKHRLLNIDELIEFN